MPIDPEKLRVGDVFNRQGISHEVIGINDWVVIFSDNRKVGGFDWFLKRTHIWQDCVIVKLADEPKESPKPTPIPPEPITPPVRRNGKFIVYLRAGIVRLVEAKTVTITGGFFVFKDDSGESRHCFAVADTPFIERIEPADLTPESPDDDSDDSPPKTIKFAA